MKKILVLFFIFLSGAIDVANSQNNVAFYKLALQWPQSFCTAANANCANSVNPFGFFTIHGLWPHQKSGNPVLGYTRQNMCTIPPPPPDNGTTVKSLVVDKKILNDMNAYWPNLKVGGNWQFWNYEWGKHGTCSPYAHNPQEYFEKALDLIKRHNIVQYLHNQGIDPATTATKTAQDFLDAIRKELGPNGQYFPEITCNRNATTKVLQLLEIRICFDVNAANVISCDKYNNQENFSFCKSSDKILFPPI